MSRTRQDLHRARRGNTHLNRTARMQDTEFLKGKAHGREHNRASRLLSALHRGAPRTQRRHSLDRVNTSFRHESILRGAAAPPPSVHSDRLVRHNGYIQLPTRGPP